MADLTDDQMEAFMLSALYHVGINNQELAVSAGKAWVQMKAERNAARSMSRAICNEAGFDQTAWGLA